MKFNIYQKFILLIYGCLFVYFSIIHVPFKTKSRGEIEYDTLFSTSSNLDTGRLVIIIAIMSTLTTVFLLLLRNVNYPFKTLSKKAIKVIMYSVSGIALLLLVAWGLSKLSNKEKAPPTEIISSPRMDSTLMIDTTTTVDLPSSRQKKAETCNEGQALLDFKSYMKFYYPDWKIYGKPVVKEQLDCTYRVQFITLDPHIRYQREVIIAEISYFYDYKKYHFRTLRGTLY